MRTNRSGTTILSHVCALLALAATSCSSSSTSSPSTPVPPSNGVAGGAQALAQTLLPRSLNGMCYVPAPSDYKTQCTDSPKDTYYDSFCYNDDFKQLWGASGGVARGDLQTLADLKVNMLHLYDWNLPSARNHVSFLAELQARGIKAAVPFSNYFVDAQDKASVEAIVTEVTQAVPSPVVMWSIGNEVDTGYLPAAEQVVTIASWIFAKDSSRLITVPLSLPFEGKMKVLKETFASQGLLNIWNDNFVASINVYDDAPAVQAHVENFAALYPGVPLLISEINRRRTDVGNDINKQATQLLAQLQKSKSLVADGQHAYFFGSYVFQWVAKPWGQFDKATQTCPPYEPFFGCNDFKGSLGTGSTTEGKAYPIDGLAPNAMHDSVRQAFQ